jgi:serine/threonine protein kinase
VANITVLTFISVQWPHFGITGERRETLNWRQRFNIIIGMARGIAYLHQEFHVCIIHRDIKSSNVLLDDDFQPKIADFGLARLLADDHSHLSTKFARTLLSKKHVKYCTGKQVHELYIYNLLLY